MECVGGTRTWTPPWSEIMGIGGFDPSAPNRGAYAGLLHGITSRPKPKLKAPTTPATEDPRIHIPPTPGMPSPRPWGQPPPASIGKARYAKCVLALI